MRNARKTFDTGSLRCYYIDLTTWVRVGHIFVPMQNNDIILEIKLRTVCSMGADMCALRADRKMNQKLVGLLAESVKCIKRLIIKVFAEGHIADQVQNVELIYKHFIYKLFWK